MGSIFQLVLVFLYLYPIKFVFLPVSSRVLLGIMGILFYSISIYNNRSLSFKIKNKFFNIYFSLFLIFIWSIITICINNTSDYQFVNYPISIIIILSASYAIKRINIKLNLRFNSKIIIDRFIGAVLIQNTLAVLMFLIPPLKNSLLSLINTDEFTLNMINATGGFRLIGFGVEFFGAGIINVLTLIIIANQMKFQQLSFKAYLYYVLAYLWILVSGVCMSRTTLIALPLSIILFIYKSKLFNFIVSNKCIKCLKIICCIAFSLIVLVISLPSSIFIKIEDLYNFGFELFINYSNDGELSSQSTSALANMYEILPATLKTWIIGDGLWTDINTGFYYMGTDIGYFRLIFYFGIIGLLLFFRYQYVLVKIAADDNNQLKPVLVLWLVGCLILNLKGFTDLSAYIILFIGTKYSFRYEDINSNALVVNGGR